MVEVSGLRKEYGRTVAVADVSFEVEAGEIFGLLGPNGSGKTTTVECLQGLRRADAGRLRVFGLDPASEAMKPPAGRQSATGLRSAGPDSGRGGTRAVCDDQP